MSSMYSTECCRASRASPHDPQRALNGLTSLSAPTGALSELVVTFGYVKVLAMCSCVYFLYIFWLTEGMKVRFPSVLTVDLVRLERLIHWKGRVAHLPRANSAMYKIAMEALTINYTDDSR